MSNLKNRRFRAPLPLRAFSSRHRNHPAIRRSVIETLESRFLLSHSSVITAASAAVFAPPILQFQSGSGLMPSVVTTAYTPAQVRAAYGVDGISFDGASADGTGQTIAIIDAYNDPQIIADANVFSGYFNLPLFNTGGPTLTVLNQSGGTTLPSNASTATGSWDVEESLDVEWAHAMAPHANIILFETGYPTANNLFQAAAYAANYPGVSVVSMSFGAGEFSGEQTFDSDFTTPAGHQGVTFLASTGDIGRPALYPAYSPNVVAVGGTHLTINDDSSYGGETAWSGSGGGISGFEPQPAYQASRVNGLSSSNRTTPDVSMVADPSTGVYIMDSFSRGGLSGKWGGTSLSAPLWAGLIAIADQGRTLDGLGTLDGPTQTLPMLYGFQSQDFHDVTIGNNGFSAAAGYDLVTGIGTPSANQIVPALVGNTVGELAFEQLPPTSVAAGENLAPALTVAVEDADGNILTKNTSSVTISILSGPGGAVLSGKISVTAVNGVATFNDLSLNICGTYTLQATAGSVSSGTSSSFDVTAGAPAMVQFMQFPSIVNAASVGGLSVSVLVEDQFGNLVTTDNSNVSLAIKTGPGALKGTSLATANNGVATFNNLSITAAGTYTLLATDGSLAGAISNSITINPGPAAYFMITSPDSVTSGNSFEFTVAAFDGFNNSATGYNGAIYFSSGDAWAVLPATTTLMNGFGTFSATLKTAGDQTITASDILNNSLIATADIPVISAGPRVASAATPAPITGTTAPLSVTGWDPAGESNLTYSWTASDDSPAPVSFSANGTNAAKNCIATFTTAGVYNLTVTITDSSGLTTTGNVIVTVDQTATNISVTPASISLNARDTQQFSATATDQFGNDLPTPSAFTWSLAAGSVGSISASGFYTAPAVSGSATVRATVGAASDTSTVTVTSPGPSVATSAKVSSTTVTGTTAALSAMGSDLAGESTLTYTWSTIGTPPGAVSFSANGTNAAKNSSAKFTAAGTYTFQVTIKDSSNLTTTSKITLTVKQTATSISVTPSTTGVNTHSTQQFIAVANDQFGAPMSTQPTFKWSLSGVGSISSTGLYSAGGTAGNAVIRATSGSISDTSSIAVTVLTVKANLSNNFNRVGVTSDGGKVSGSGIDGAGNTYSANLFQAMSSRYKLGNSNTNNVIAAAGQTVALPQGKFSTLSLIGSGINGQKTGKSFTVHYTDGTSRTYTVNLSNWLSPSNYSGESTVLAMAYRNKTNGGRTTSKTYLYQYSLALNNAKTIASITLPSNTNSVIVAAINLNS